MVRLYHVIRVKMNLMPKICFKVKVEGKLNYTKGIILREQSKQMVKFFEYMVCNCGPRKFYWLYCVRKKD